MSLRGFTLIELMIVIAIIAIITAIAVPSVLRARLAADEAAAIGACKAFGTAQEMYRRTDWDGDGIKEYAKNIGQNGGLGNGESLYYNNRKHDVIGLVDKSFADAEGDASSGTVVAKSGYVFKVLVDATWPNVHSFLTVNDNLTLGYAISAVPYAYGVSGINKFLMAGDAVIYQNDMGDNIHPTTYSADPAQGWLAAE